MFMAFMTLVIIVSAPMLGGRLSRLSTVRFRRAGFLVAALAIQVLITEILVGAGAAVTVPLHLFSYVLAGYVLWLNRRLPGLVLIGLGTLSNSVVIALNGGTLPASAPALRDAGLATDAKGFENSGVLTHPLLPWLGDVAATPSWLPFRNVISVGDAAILVGAALFVHVTSRSAPWRGFASARARSLGRARAGSVSRPAGPGSHLSPPDPSASASLG